MARRGRGGGARMMLVDDAHHMYHTRMYHMYQLLQSSILNYSAVAPIDREACSNLQISQSLGYRNYRDS